MPFSHKGRVSTTSIAVLFFIAAVLAVPRPASAGFLAKVLGFFGMETRADAEIPSSAAELAIPLMGSQDSLQPAIGGPLEDDIALLTTQDNALVSSRNPLGTIPRPASDRIVVYTVQPGDTISGIAEQFGISVNTLIWANNLQRGSQLKVGEELVILPVTGIQYKIKKGDTLDGIAKKFKADTADIVSFNGLAIGEPLPAEEVIIVPDGEFAPPPPAGRSQPTRFAVLPEHIGYYIRPILGGRRSRGLHGFNGVDLADSCGLSVLASAEGTVILARSSGWNGGYGRYIVLNHPNGTQTLYAHLSSILASVGQKVAQGAQIATIGSTGNSTGCHLHFETRGARNPF